MLTGGVVSVMLPLGSSCCRGSAALYSHSKDQCRSYSASDCHMDEFDTKSDCQQLTSDLCGDGPHSTVTRLFRLANARVWVVQESDLSPQHPEACHMLT